MIVLGVCCRGILATYWWEHHGDMVLATAQFPPGIRNCSPRVFRWDERYVAGIIARNISPRIRWLSMTRLILLDSWIGAMLAAVWPVSGTCARSSRNRMSHRNTPSSWAPSQSTFASKLTIPVIWESIVRSGCRKNGSTMKAKWNKNSSNTDWESVRCDCGHHAHRNRR
jgi:hypothetical protein